MPVVENLPRHRFCPVADRQELCDAWVLALVEPAADREFIEAKRTAKRSPISFCMRFNLADQEFAKQLQ